jgi:cytochrome b561
MRPAVDRYDGVAQSFHWVVLLLVVAQYATKWLPAGFATMSEGQLNAWHLAIGPTVLLLMLFRLAWRLTHHTPPPPADLPAPLRLLSRATHWLFYAILVVLPVLGWVAASGYGANVTLLKLVPLPALVAKDKSLAESVGSVHGALAWALLGVIALHVSGALYHALVKQDGVVRRMVPGRG